MAGYIISQLVAQGAMVGDVLLMPYSSTDLLAQFSLTTFAVMGAGAGLAGLIGLITKQYMFAAGAAAIWCVGLFFNVGNWLLNGFPMMMSILLGGTGLDFLSVVFTVGFTLIFFFGLANTLRGGESATG
jgi:hypothetical protein